MAPSEDINDARTTYSRFIGVLKWTVPALAALTLLVIILIA